MVVLSCDGRLRPAQLLVYAGIAISPRLGEGGAADATQLLTYPIAAAQLLWLLRYLELALCSRREVRRAWWGSHDGRRLQPHVACAHN